MVEVSSVYLNDLLKTLESVIVKDTHFDMLRP